jgi:hypothetical protein
VTSKTGNTTKHLQKNAFVHVGSQMKTSQAYAHNQDKQSSVVVQQCGQCQHPEGYIDILKQDDLASLFMFESAQGILGHNNKQGLTVFKQLYITSSATRSHGWCSANYSCRWDFFEQ